MELGLAGKRALITGGSRGLGRAVALALAREGVRVGLIARNTVRLRQVLEEIGGQLQGHAIISADLMEAGGPERALSALEAEGGSFDIAVHNVGGTLGLKDPLSPEAAWAEAWRFNVGIAIALNQQLIPSMARNGWGRIVHVSSNAAAHLRGAAPYAAAKAYLNAYVQAVGRAQAAHGVILSAVMPGPFEAEGGHWERVRTEDPETYTDYLRHHQALGRLVESDEIAAAITFLASKHAAPAAAAVLNLDGAAY